MINLIKNIHLAVETQNNVFYIKEEYNEKHEI